MKLALKTYGCQMNERDSNMLSALLVQAGHELAESEFDADLIIVNTCSVREKAEQKALGKLGLLIASKRARPDRIVGAAGCMVQRLGADIMRALPGLDFAVGTQQLWTLPSAVEAVLAGRGPIVNVAEQGRAPEASLRSRGQAGVSEFINILFGCDRRCSYCVVPDVRGREWSRKAAAVIEEAEEVAAAGTKEIILLGQSVLSYGKTDSVWNDADVSVRGYKEAFPRLLEALSELEGLERIRFTSAHPSGCTEELVRAMAELRPVCEHIHMPFQSGSDRVLKLMRRGYSSADFRAAVERLRGALPGLAITTDVIVGYPSETVDDFEATRAFMDELMFDNAFIFKYSPRQGTHAALLADDVRADEKLRRNHVLLQDQDRRGLALNEKLIGQDIEVLVEGASRRNRLRASGRARSNKIVVFDSDPLPAPGEMVRVSVERAGPQTLYGKMKDA